MESSDEFANDVLRGADEIAQFLFGDGNLRRKVYHLAATSNLPIFKLGSMICVRKSVVLRWVETQELRHANDNREPPAKIVRIGKV